MLDDAVKALTQMLSPPLRAVLWKSIALALALIVVAAIALDLGADLVGEKAADHGGHRRHQKHAADDDAEACRNRK